MYETKLEQNEYHDIGIESGALPITTIHIIQKDSRIVVELECIDELIEQLKTAKKYLV